MAEAKIIPHDRCPRCGAGPGHVGECLEALATEAARKSFEPNPDHTGPSGMRRSIHRSHRGEGFNHVD